MNDRLYQWFFGEELELDESCDFTFSYNGCLYMVPKSSLKGQEDTIIYRLKDRLLRGIITTALINSSTLRAISNEIRQTYNHVHGCHFLVGTKKQNGEEIYIFRKSGRIRNRHIPVDERFPFLFGDLFLFAAGMAYAIFYAYYLSGFDYFSAILKTPNTITIICAILMVQVFGLVWINKMKVRGGNAFLACCIPLNLATIFILLFSGLRIMLVFIALIIIILLSVSAHDILILKASVIQLSAVKVLRRLIRSFPVSALRSTAAVCIIFFFYMLFMEPAISYKTAVVPTEPPSAVSTIPEDLQYNNIAFSAALKQIDADIWPNLTIEQKVADLQAIVDKESATCLFIVNPTVTYEQKGSNTLGSYQEVGNKIALSKTHLENSEPEYILVTTLHELRHSWQHQMVANVIEPLQRSRPILLNQELFDEWLTYQTEFDHYIDYDKDPEGYSTQLCELDADYWSRTKVKEEYEKYINND